MWFLLKCFNPHTHPFVPAEKIANISVDFRTKRRKKNMIKFSNLNCTDDLFCAQTERENAPAAFAFYVTLVSFGAFGTLTNYMWYVISPLIKRSSPRCLIFRKMYFKLLCICPHGRVEFQQEVYEHFKNLCSQQFSLLPQRLHKWYLLVCCHKLRI